MSEPGFSDSRPEAAPAQPTNSSTSMRATPMRSAASTDSRRKSRVNPRIKRRKSALRQRLEFASVIQAHKFVDAKTFSKEAVLEMIASIPKDKKAEYERAFRLFDQNGTNSITAKDIVKVMSTLGWAANLETIDYMVQEVPSSPP